jgi:hypothetical protein
MPNEEVMMYSMWQAQEAQTAQPAQQQVQPRPTREEMRQQIEDAIRAAQEAAGVPIPEIAVQPRTPPPFPFQEGPPEGIVVLIIVIASLAAATIIFGPLFRALGRRLERRGDTASVDAEQVTPRLDRIEQAIEAMAVEVERISEGQRYVTKQMHELRALPSPNPLAQPAMAQRAAEPARRGEP